MTSSEQREYLPDDEKPGRLRRTVAPGSVPLASVSAFAGDSAMTSAEGARIRTLKDQRGSVFFSDLLYAISHQHFDPEVAEVLWNKILAHKFSLSATLERNVGITVATLDYFVNITGDMHSLTLMSETHVADIVNMSMRDGMTGLFNHATCYELLDLELKSYWRYGVGVVLILLDIDEFKAVNDRGGHQEGDRVLLEIARTLRRETRDSDICCRFGGDEFAVILPFTNSLDEALRVAERIRRCGRKLASNGHRITISAGLASCDDTTETVHVLVERADRALYHAKETGKNKVVVSGTFGNVPDPDAE